MPSCFCCDGWIDPDAGYAESVVKPQGPLKEVLDPYTVDICASCLREHQVVADHPDPIEVSTVIQVEPETEPATDGGGPA